MNTLSLTTLLESANSQPTNVLPKGIPLNEPLLATAIINSNGGKGLLIENQFLKALLPEHLEVGSKLEVIFFKNGNELVLQIISQDPKNFTTANQSTPLKTLDSAKSEISTAFKNILKALLPDLELGDIKKAYQPKVSLVNLLQQFTEKSIDKNNITELTKEFETLFNKGSVLNKQSLKSPEKLTEILKKFIGQQLHKETFNEKNSILKNIFAGPPLQEQAFNKNDIQELNNLTKILSQLPQKDMQSLSDDIAKISGQTLTALFASPLPLPTQNITLPQSPLADFVSILMKLKFASQGESVQTQSQSNLSTDLTKLMQQLEQSIEQNKTEVSSKKIFDKILKSVLKDSNQGNPSLIESSSDKKEKVSQFLKQIVQSQDQMSKLQPLMKALGEPLFAFMPVILGGIFQNWEMRIDSPQQFTDSKNKKSSKSTEFTRVHLAIELPSLGAIQIDFAHREKEVLLSLMFEDEDLTEFVDKSMPILRHKLQSLGYDYPSLVTRTGTPKNVQPTWVEEAIQNSTIA